jgi:hypothetical protein
MVIIITVKSTGRTPPAVPQAASRLVKAKASFDIGSVSVAPKMTA